MSSGHSSLKLSPSSVSAVTHSTGDRPGQACGQAAQYTATQHQPHEVWWASFAPRTAIDDYTLVLAFATIGLLVVTGFLAKSQRDAVKNLVAVEQADIVVTLENFVNMPGYHPFDIVVNNIGRSTALITAVMVAWIETADAEGVAVGGLNTYIVKAGESQKIKPLPARSVADLSKARFLNIVVEFDSPLRGQTQARYVLEVWGRQSSVPYREVKREHRKLKRGHRPPSSAWGQFLRLLGARG